MSVRLAARSGSILFPLLTGAASITFAVAGCAMSMDESAGTRRAERLGAGLSAVATELALGNGYSCALKDDGTAACWGSNGFGALGDGTTTARLVPTAVTGLTSATQLAAGDHTCALIDDGTAQCWGSNGNGQLGDGTTDTQLLPTPTADLGDVSQITSGWGHTCVLAGDGSVACFGGNDQGQLGVGTFDRTEHTAPETVVGLSGVGRISAGSISTCALVTGGAAPGTVQCWGFGENGSLGDGLATSRATAAPVKGIGTAVDISVGNAGACAVLADGTVWCWGNLRRHGGGGDGSTLPRIVGKVRGAARVAVGSGFACALLTDGTVSCWGSNDDGALGDGTRVSRPDGAIVAGLTKVQRLAAGADHVCAIADAGAVYCWGRNRWGEVGDGTSLVPRLRPVKVAL